MTTEAATFTCSICGEPSTEICISCTKDSCRNHRCQRCKRCSDCCECEVPLSEMEPETAEAAAEPPAAEPPTAPAMEEAPPQSADPAGHSEPPEPPFEQW